MIYSFSSWEVALYASQKFWTHSAPFLNKWHQSIHVSYQFSLMILKLSLSWNFPGGSLTKTLCSQCRESGVQSWSGNYIPHVATKSWYRQVLSISTHNYHYALDLSISFLLHLLHLYPNWFFWLSTLAFSKALFSQNNTWDCLFSRLVLLNRTFCNDRLIPYLQYLLGWLLATWNMASEIEELNF